MKKSKNGKGKNKKSSTSKTTDKGRRKFLQALGGAAVTGAAGLEDAFLSAAFAATPAVNALPAQEARAAAQKVFDATRNASTLDEALGKKGLKRADEYARVFRPVSKKLGRAKQIVIVPYHPADKSAKVVGSIGISEGEPASAVSIELDGTKVVRFTTHDTFGGKLVEREFNPAEVTAKNIGKLVETDLPRENLEPDLPVSVSAGASAVAFRDLLAEEQKAKVYTPAQARGFLTNTPTVRLIAQLQYARLKGLTMSPGNSCCCCCSCCWGSCSSCSAVSSPKYLGGKFHRNGGVVQRVPHCEPA
jgi:hypothetical protein